MLRHFTSSLLLTALGFGLLAGPHLCKPLHQERESGHATCHEAATPSTHSEVDPDARSQSDRQDCCSTFCQHACQMTAVAEAGLVTIDMAPVSQAVLEATDLGLPFFAHPIDHVPLA